MGAAAALPCRRRAARGGGAARGAALWAARIVGCGCRAGRLPRAPGFERALECAGGAASRGFSRYPRGKLAPRARALSNNAEQCFVTEAYALYFGPPGAARFTGDPPGPPDARPGSFSAAARARRGPSRTHLYTAAAARRRAPRTGEHAEDQTNSTRWAPTSPSTPSRGARSPRAGRASSPRSCTEATTRRRTACSSSGVRTGKKRVLWSSR